MNPIMLIAATADASNTDLEGIAYGVLIAVLVWCIAAILVPFWIWEIRAQNIQQTKLLRALLEKPAIKVGTQSPPPIHRTPPAPARPTTARIPVR